MGVVERSRRYYSVPLEVPFLSGGQLSAARGGLRLIQRPTRSSTSTAPPYRRTPSRRTYRVGGNPRRAGARSTTVRLSYNHASGL